MVAVPSTVARGGGNCLNSSTIQGLCYVRGHTLICLGCCSSRGCLLEPTLSSRSYKSHLPWGSLQLVFPSSAGHRPSLTVEANNTFFVLNNSAKLIEHLSCTGQGRTLLWVNDSVSNPWALLTGFAHAQFPLPVLNLF